MKYAILHIGTQQNTPLISTQIERRHRSFPKMKGDDKKHEIRFKQIERTLKNKNL